MQGEGTSDKRFSVYTLALQACGKCCPTRGACVGSGWTEWRGGCPTWCCVCLFVQPLRCLIIYAHTHIHSGWDSTGAVLINLILYVQSMGENNNLVVLVETVQNAIKVPRDSGTLFLFSFNQTVPLILLWIIQDLINGTYLFFFSQSHPVSGVTVTE